MVLELEIDRSDPPGENDDNGNGTGKNNINETKEQPDYVHLLPPDKKNGDERNTEKLD